MFFALFLHAPHDAQIPRPNLRERRPGEVPLRVGAVRLRGSSLHFCRYDGIGAGPEVSEAAAWAAAWTGGAGSLLVVSAANAPNGFRDAARAASAGGRLARAGIPDGESRIIPAPPIRRRGLGVKLPRHMEATLHEEGCCHGKKPLRQ
ncbi:MAG TPA: hypothetical protein VGC15_23555 [Acetobacteraceae bacterium]